MLAIELEVLIIRIVFVIISFVGCIWHVCDISSIYFSYKTNVNVQFEREVKVELPAITLCSNTESVISEALKNSQDNTYENVTESPIKKLQDLPLGKQLSEATIGSKQFFNECLVLKPISMENNFIDDYIGCENVSKIVESIGFYRKCFTLFSQKNNENENNYRIDHDIKFRDNAFPLYQIVLNNRYLKGLVLFVHSRHQPFLGFIGGQTNGIHLNNTKYVSFTLTYVKTTTRLLPTPYETNCLDYHSIGYRSQTHCIIKCKADYFRQKFDGWHPDILYSEEYEGNLNYAEEKWRTNKTLDKEIANHCQSVCGKKDDCFSEYFTTSFIGQWEREGINEDINGVYFYLPTGLNTRYIHSPRLHLIEYICYTASVFSLWFGISMTTISRVIITVYNNFKNKNNRDLRKREEPTEGWSELVKV